MPVQLLMLVMQQQLLLLVLLIAEELVSSVLCGVCWASELVRVLMELMGVRKGVRFQVRAREPQHGNEEWVRQAGVCLV